MKIVYANEKVEEQCTSMKSAKKLLGGDETLARNLMSRVTALQQAITINDIIAQPTFHFHNLHNIGRKKLEGFYAIDLKSRREKWRMILQLLDENEEPFERCSIDKIAPYVRVVEIVEVSNHYE
ncbi:Plasmid maintenance system killer protein [Lachnospiraceae bacterium A10]|nr:Plasmid maintenance system killer protein [Lachnospiraceae bacterium A10]